MKSPLAVINVIILQLTLKALDFTLYKNMVMAKRYTNALNVNTRPLFYGITRSVDVNPLVLYSIPHVEQFSPLSCMLPPNNAVECASTLLLFQLHLRTHSEARPYLCDMCGYSAKRPHGLTKHYRY